MALGPPHNTIAVCVIWCHNSGRIVLCNKYTGFVYVLSDVSTNDHSGSTGLYNEYIDLVYVLSNVYTINNSAKTVLCKGCNEKLYTTIIYIGGSLSSNNKVSLSSILEKKIIKLSYFLKSYWYSFMGFKTLFKRISIGGSLSSNDKVSLSSILEKKP